MILMLCFVFDLIVLGGLFLGCLCFRLCCWGELGFQGWLVHLCGGLVVWFVVWRVVVGVAC